MREQKNQRAMPFPAHRAGINFIMIFSLGHSGLIELPAIQIAALSAHHRFAQPVLAAIHVLSFVYLSIYGTPFTGSNAQHFLE